MKVTFSVIRHINDLGIAVRLVEQHLP